MTTTAQGFPNDAVARRFIGRTVNEGRIAKKWSLDQLAIEAQWGKSTLQRMEKADPHVRFKPRDLRELLDVLSFEEEFKAVLMSLAATLQSGQSGEASTEWWKEYLGYAVPAWFELYIRLEYEASGIRMYEGELVPGVLQSRKYAEEVIKHSLPDLYDQEVAEQRVKARLERQSLLTRKNPPRLSVVLNEGVIARTCGMSADIAREQLQKLLDVSEQPHMELLVLAYEAGIHGGMSGTAGFSALTFPLLAGTDRPVEPPLIYSDFPTGSQYQSEPEDVAVYDRIWQALENKALDPEASRKVLLEALKGLS